LERICCYLHHQREWAPTRLDLALDDYGKTLDLDAVIGAVEAGNYAGAQCCQVVKSGKRGGGRWGVAVVLGSASSDKRVTIYDKEVESEGRIKAIRIEVRLRDDLARQAWNKLFPTLFDPNLTAGYVLGSISFLERRGRHLSRARLLDWWQKFVSYVRTTPKKLRRLPRHRTVEKALGWLRRQVAPTLTTLARVCGPRLLSRLFEEGDKRYQKNEWLKTLEAQFRLELKELQEWGIRMGERFYTKTDLTSMTG